MLDDIKGGHGACDNLRERGEELHVIHARQRVPHRDEYLRPRPGLRIAPKEQRLLARPHLAVCVRHAHPALVRPLAVPARVIRSASRSLLVRSEYVPGERTSPAITTVRWKSNSGCFKISTLSNAFSTTSGAEPAGEKGSPGGPA